MLSTQKRNRFAFRGIEMFDAIICLPTNTFLLESIMCTMASLGCLCLTYVISLRTVQRVIIAIIAVRMW